MAKQLTFSEEARAAMKRGIDTMADTVGVTLGPRGRNVVLDKKFGPPQVCSDGVTIAKEIHHAARNMPLSDALAMGAQQNSLISASGWLAQSAAKFSAGRKQR